MIRALVVAALLVLATPALAQQPAQVYSSGDYGTVVAQQPTAGAPAVAAAPTPSTTSVTINFAGLVEALLPLAQSAALALITIAGSWLAWLLKKKFGIEVDAGMRDALETGLKNQASSLIARGAVSLEGKSIKVDNAALARSVDIIANKAVPGAVKHFGLTPQAIQAKILDAVPQAPGMSAAVASVRAPPAPPTT